MKKALTFTALLVLCLALLAGCGHTHEWTAANCTTPKTCADCGETEGEALGHNWTEASCAAPKTCAACGVTEGEALPHQFGEASCTEAKTCAVCGATEGDALGHQLSEANFQSPALCSVCGESVGDVLTPDFVGNGIELDLIAVGDSADYITCDSTGGDTDIVGKTTLMSYDIYSSFKDIEAREGYECRVAVFDTVFGSDALERGAKAMFCVTDYYDIDLFAENPDHSNATYSVTHVNIDGEDQPVYVSQLGDYHVDSDTLTFSFTVCVQVPVGYDGIVCGLAYSDVCQPMGFSTACYSPENFVFFRMGN